MVAVTAGLRRQAALELLLPNVPRDKHKPGAHMDLGPMWERRGKCGHGGIWRGSIAATGVSTGLADVL